MSHLPEVLLFVKAGADGKCYGACPFCQHIFMILMVKARVQKLKFKVATVNLAKPPEEFKKFGLRRVPAIVHAENSIDSVDDILQYLDNIFPENELNYNNTEAEKSCKDIFQKFCFFIKEVSKNSSHLMSELKKLNEFLLSNETSFLCGNKISHLDCEVLPKLHHIRIASMCLKQFEISLDLRGIWRYLKNAYNNDIFIKTCPSDQEISLHWADKPETPNFTIEQHAQITKEEARYSLSVPPGI
ncbi:chloride intracellular channel exl-1-like [Tachypleus tridentatus]|uniref:chloride intracellular channel exl-1-like n=1 Tax=Tachypleus tridentatus TaxID=6853 RepID=UPI003FD1CD16